MHKDLKIAIPRNIGKGHTTAQAYWDLVRKHGGSRKAMVAFICGIGGYSDRHERWPIEFSVKCYGANMEAEHLWEKIIPEFLDDADSAGMARARTLFDAAYEKHKDNLWQWGTEEAYESWKDSDTPYETFTGRRIEWSHELRGRSGGHLVMTACGAIGLECSTDDLEAELTDTDGSAGRPYVIDHAEVRDLFIICVQNSVDLTRKNIESEVEYFAAWRLWTSFCEPEFGKPAPVTLPAQTSDEVTVQTGVIWKDLTRKYGTGSAQCNAFLEVCRIANITVPGTK